MKNLLTLFTCFSILISVAQNENSITDKQVIIEYVIYFLDDNVVSKETLSKRIETSYSGIELISDLPNIEDVKGTQLIISEVNDVKNEFPPMNLEYLQYMSQGLSDEEKTTLQDSRFALILDFIAEKSKITQTLTLANQLINDLAKDRAIVIYDSETRETFNASFWKNKRQITDGTFSIANHITIHFYQKNEYCRAITLGMLKFGLPDLVIENLSCRSSLSLTSLINLTAQTLLEQDKIGDRNELQLNIETLKSTQLKSILLDAIYNNAEKKATIQFIDGAPEEGDPENRLFEIAFYGDNPQIQQDALLTKLFGSKDEVTMLRHDEELLAASDAAKAKIPELFEKFSKGLPFNQSLLIKFPFDNENDEREWMWVEVTKWENDNVSGLLQNEPVIVTDLKAGQKVEKNIHLMFDYILFEGDTIIEGNETGKIMMKNQN